MGLNLNEAKTHTVVLDPAYLPGGISQRTPQLRRLSTPARSRDMMLSGERLRGMQPEEGLPECVEMILRENTQRGDRVPFPLKTGVRVLGVEIDCYLSMDGYFASMLKKAQARRGILSRVARSS